MTNEQEKALVAETAGEAVAWCLQFPGKPPQSHTYATEEIAQGWADLDRELGAKVIPLYAAPVPAQDDDKLREAGWSVAVHNDYRLNGEAHTFWLWTHPDGRWIKGEGRTDTEALAQCAEALAALKSTAAQEGGST